MTSSSNVGDNTAAHLNVCHAARVERCVHDFGALRLVLTREPANDRMTRHAHDITSVSVVLGGALVEEAEHRSVVALSGSVVVKPAGVYHANRFGPTDVLICRVDVLEPTDEPMVSRHALAHWSWRWRPGAVRLVRAALAGPARLDRGAALRLALDLLETVDERAGQRRAPSWVLDASREILQGAPDSRPPSVSEIARAVGRHRGSVARWFRAEYGFSIRELRRREMVERAARLIVTSDRTLSAIAHSCGFADHAHMTRAIRAAAGMTPTALRTALGKTRTTLVAAG